MNISKHSGAASCNASLTFTQDWVILEIRDTGVGFDLDEKKAAAAWASKACVKGLRSASGGLRIYSAPGRGTRVHAEVTIDRTVTEKPQTDMDRTNENESNLPAA
jgi:signal transduction histidine kinase